MGNVINMGMILLKTIWSACITNDSNTNIQRRTSELTVGYIKDGIFINEKNEKYQIYDENNYTAGSKCVRLIEQRFPNSEESVNIFEIRFKLEEELQQVIKDYDIEICKKDIWSAYIISSTNTYDQRGILRLTVGCVKDGIFTSEKYKKYKIYDGRNYIVGNEYVGLIERRFPCNEEVLHIFEAIPIMEKELQKIKDRSGVICKEDIWSVNILVGTITHNSIGRGEKQMVGYIKNGIFNSIMGGEYPLYDKDYIAAGVEYASKIQSCFKNNKETLDIPEAMCMMIEQIQQITKDGGVILAGDNSNTPSDSIETGPFVK